MPGTPRSPKLRAALEARARTMRRDGASMAEIERAVGVPAPTLYQWAARGGWRLCDLEEDSLLSSLTSVGSVLAARGQAPLAAGGYWPCDAFGVGESGPVSPDALRSAGDAAFAAALGLAATGQVKAAREQLLLGQRFIAAAGVMPAGAEPDAVDCGFDDPRAEMERRLLRLLDVEVKRRADQIGLHRLSEAVDVEALDLSMFEISDSEYRAATPAELARMEAGDWPTTSS